MVVVQLIVIVTEEPEFESVFELAAGFLALNRFAGQTPLEIRKRFERCPDRLLKLAEDEALRLGCKRRRAYSLS